MFERDSSFCFFLLPSKHQKGVMVGSVSVDRVRTSCGVSMCCAPAVSGQDFMLRSLGDCYDRMPQHGMVSAIDLLIRACHGIHSFMAMCRLGKQDQKRKQILKKKNEILEKKFWSFEGYKKRQTLQAPGRSWCYEFSSLNHDVENQPLMFKQPGLKHLSIFQPRVTKAQWHVVWIWILWLKSDSCSKITVCTFCSSAHWAAVQCCSMLFNGSCWRCFETRFMRIPQLCSWSWQGPQTSWYISARPQRVR